MVARTMLKIFGISAIALAMAAGCGGKGEVKINSADDAKKDSKPFEAPTIGKSSGGGVSGGLTEEDEKLVIPGSQFGEAPPVKYPPKKKRRKKKGPVEIIIPYSEGIADQMEGLVWGMSARKVMSIFEHKIKETFSEELKAVSGDALAEDGVRTKMLREISKMKKSYIEFKGQRTGFEAHMVSEEFTHNNDEAMLVWDAGKYVEYLFFIDGRFWKRLRAFRKDSFKSEITFMDFLGSVEGRFGVQGQEMFNDRGDLDRVSWRDEETYADVLDRSAFFGAYGLKFTCAVTATYIDKLRTNEGRDKGSVGNDISGMVDTVTSSSGSLSDNDSSVIDGYTGENLGGSELDTSHSVTNQHKKGKKEKKKEEKKEEPAPKKKEGTKDDIDDLF